MTWLTRQPLIPLLVLVIVTAALGVPAMRIQFDYQLEKFFPTGTADRASFDRMQALFGRDDQTGLIHAARHDAALTGEDFRALSRAGRRLEDTGRYERVVSPAEVPLLLRGSDGRLRIEAALPEGFDEARLTLALSRLKRDPFVRVVLSEDGRDAMLGATMRSDRASMADRRQTRLDLQVQARRLAAEQGLEAHIGGYPVQRDLLIEAINDEFAALYPFVLLVICVVLALVFRNPIGTIAPLLVVALATVWATGLMQLTAMPPNIFAVAVYVLIAVIGVSDSIHFLSRYGELRGGGAEAIPAVERTVRDLLLPCFLTSLTTAIAFAALALSSVPMIAHFGLQTAMGVLVAYVVTILLIPALLVLFTPQIPKTEAMALGGWLARVDEFVAKFARPIVLGAATLTIVGAAGISLINVNSPLLADLDPDHPILETNRILEDRMAGVIGLELLIEPASQDLWEVYGPERLARIDTLTNRLRELPEVITATSIIDPIRHFADELTVRADPATLLPAALLLADNQLDAWINEEARVMRIRMRVRDTDTDAALALFGEINRLYEAVLGTSSAGRLTGQGYIGQMINERIVFHLQLSFLAAMAAVIATLLIVLRDVRLTLASLLPNLLPVVVLSGLMGYAGIDLRYTSALVLAVVFGLAIDDTIHFVTQVRTSREPDPISGAFATVGPGIVLTSVILGLGFSVLLIGSLVPNRILGGMLLATAVLALAGDLFVLPATLRLWRRAA